MKTKPKKTAKRRPTTRPRAARRRNTPLVTLAAAAVMVGLSILGDDPKGREICEKCAHPKSDHCSGFRHCHGGAPKTSHERDIRKMVDEGTIIDAGLCECVAFEPSGKFEPKANPLRDFVEVLRDAKKGFHE